MKISERKVFSPVIRSFAKHLRLYQYFRRNENLHSAYKKTEERNENENTQSVKALRTSTCSKSQQGTCYKHLAEH